MPGPYIAEQVVVLDNTDGDPLFSTAHPGKVEVVGGGGGGGGVVDTELPAAAALADGAANPTAPTVGAHLLVWNGATWDRLTASAPADAIATSIARLRTTAAQLGFNGATWDRVRVANVYKAVSLSAAADTQSLWTPAAGKRFRLMGLYLTSNATGLLTFNDGVGGTAIFIPRPAGNAIISVNFGQGILSAAANNVLSLVRSASTAIDGVVWGTEE